MIPSGSKTIPKSATPASKVGHGCRRGTGGPRILPAGLAASGGARMAVQPALTTIALRPRNMAKTTAPAASSPAPQSYEDALAELERLVAAMEAGQLPLDKLLDSYRRGAELLGFCRARLAVVEQQVKVLEDGQLKPWASA
jgi:exodeoxyribonuclease VII small subunit